MALPADLRTDLDGVGGDDVTLAFQGHLIWQSGSG